MPTEQPGPGLPPTEDAKLEVIQEWNGAAETHLAMQGIQFNPDTGLRLMIRALAQGMGIDTAEFNHLCEVQRMRAIIEASDPERIAAAKAAAIEAARRAQLMIPGHPGQNGGGF